MDRRHFCANGLVGLAGLTLMPSGVLFANAKDKIKLGYIGVGLRGRNHISEGLLRSDVEITAICDTQESSLKYCRAQFVKAGKKLPAEYTGGLDAYKKLLERKDIDAVIIATPWEFHKEQAIDAMRAGKYVGCEVIAGITVEDHWEILKVYEETKIPYMTLENVCYRRDVLAVLNMVRNNVFGELIHLEGGYQHDLRGVLFNDGKSFDGKGGEFGPNTVGEAQWRTQWNADRNGDIYPTHGAGPIMNYIDINRGNQFTNLVSFASKSRGLHQYIEKKSPGNKNLAVNFKNGDLVTTMLNCANGETVTLTHDTHLPRPYSLGFRVQGTRGLWMDVADSIYIEGESGTYDEWDKAKIWLDKYDHPLWKKHQHEADGAGHGGMDWFVFNAFVEAVKQRIQTPIDIYDSLTMSVITPLSEKSIQEGNMPQQFPDFTKGKWKDLKNTFALNNKF
ncbi:Twin-arginine translocation pathway signal protein [Pedobacter cryoconitis]|uniref:Twin-arginine translocation pathway signal protein n=1 Tax=Pedobacter cryoconitis TaxID=188932 RepID=A0A127VKI6_9SPHI|nr:Gfo/Idh/MocA family oxidoreductase [Pedobacter cryoconitis]AMQ01846.1 Twin-arginine translocation pathway signal protein [Pedobacter cryoconitis]